MFLKNLFYNLVSRIHTRILLLIITMLLPLFLIQGYIYYDRFQAKMADEAKANLEIARFAALFFNRLVNTISDRQMAIDALAFSPSPSLKDIQLLLDLSAKELPIVRDWFWISPQGRVIANSSRNGIGTDLSDRPYFRKAVAGQERVISDLVRSRVDGIPIFTISHPIRNEDNLLLGVLAASITPHRFGEILAFDRIGSADISIYDPQGRLVYRCPEIRLPWEKLDFQKNHQAIQAAISGHEAVSTAQSIVNNEDTIIATAPIGDTKWVAWAGRSRNEILKPILYHLTLHFLIFFSVAAIGTLTALKIAMTIVKPLENLHRQISQHGKASKPIRIDSRGPVEISGLATALNQMQQKILTRETKLREAHDELEMRVQERTAELTKSNTTLNEYAAKLEKLNKELQEFVFVASHDLQEPLRKIQIFGNMLVEQYGKSIEEQGQDYIMRMTRAAERMSNLLRSLLEYSRITTFQKNFEPVELGKVVEEAISDLELIISKNNAVVECGQLPVIDADADQMRQVFENLIGNAIKYRKQFNNPNIKISADENDGKCRIIVQDNGIGFDEQYVDLIFRPFQRLHGGTSPYEGTGIGLAICRKVVERHGGKITAKSTQGQGSTFIIELPLKQAQAAES